MQITQLILNKITNKMNHSNNRMSKKFSQIYQNSHYNSFKITQITKIRLNLYIKQTSNSTRNLMIHLTKVLLGTKTTKFLKKITSRNQHQSSVTYTE